MDTAPHYQHGTAHQQLVTTAGKLLDRFAICTKIGYHHTATGRNTHSLDRTSSAPPPSPRCGA
ncbi:hypothetical protein [Saccharopolyspora pogona]|uniref:hypothetical protein n=1 Tax=Saccharopolyspora pogona TaxID=333966 RepID=UPI001CC26860|nr:hypothetical protein [Saccharopolyspora pogona]